MNVKAVKIVSENEKLLELKKNSRINRKSTIQNWILYGVIYCGFITYMISLVIWG